MDLTKQSRDRVKVLDAEYTMEESGNNIPQPIIHLFCRDEDRNYRRIDVEGFRPYFSVSFDTFEEKLSNIINDRRVIAVEGDLRRFGSDPIESPPEDPNALAEALTSFGNQTQVYHNPNPNNTLDGNKIVKIFTIKPEYVSEMREHFDKTYEADVPFTRRFLISSEIYVGASVPSGEDRVRYENWDGYSTSSECIKEINPADPPNVDPRIATVDIEVATEGGGVPDPAEAKHPVTAITAYDNYTEKYTAWILEREEWDSISEDGFKEEVKNQLDIELNEMNVINHEGAMLENFNQWFVEKNFDMATGWNSNSFDYPYIIERSYNVSAYGIRDWDVFRNPFTVGDEWPDPYVNGVVLFDMLEAYKKTQFRELTSYSLEDVAQAELGMGKEDIDDLDEAWKEDPIQFLVYNVRDVEAVVEIEESNGLVELYDNMREVTGALYNTCNNNGPMLDTLFLRRAYEDGLSLPTNQPVPPEEGKYHGAKVFDVVPGKHDNAVYPDLASLYPNLFSMLNLGQETVIGDEEDLSDSSYTREDVYRVPVDERSFKTVPKGKSYDNIDKEEYKGVLSEEGGLREIFDPKYDDLYVLKPSIKESFIRSTIDDLIELKYKYTGKKYSAIKRVTNSVYGVAGDSESGGKGFRLFNRHVAEGITLAGRRTIEYTAEEFTSYIQDNFDEDAYLVAGDTDSCVTSIPNAPSYRKTKEWSEKACQYVDNKYDEFVQEEFDMSPEDEHRLKVELESVASGLFYIRDFDADKNVGVKKRYAQHILWDDDDGWLDLSGDTEYDALNDPDKRSNIAEESEVNYKKYEDMMPNRDPKSDVKIKGFEYVRSDSAIITREAQKRVLTDILLSDNKKEDIYSYLESVINDIENGEIENAKLGRPKKIKNNIDEYGWKNYEELQKDENYVVNEKDKKYGGRYVSTPSPGYRGAKYTSEEFEWEDISAGSKPLQFYVERVRGEYPSTYDYDNYPQDNRPNPPEVGREVDAISVDNPGKIPDEIVIDKDKMIDKALKSKLNPILRTIGMSWEDVVGRGRQTGLDQW